MSLILDALRKSEAERRRGQSPDLFSAPGLSAPASHPGLRWWPVAVFVVLLLASAWVVWDGRTQRALDDVAAADDVAAVDAVLPADAAVAGDSIAAGGEPDGAAAAVAVAPASDTAQAAPRGKATAATAPPAPPRATPPAPPAATAPAAVAPRAVAAPVPADPRAVPAFPPAPPLPAPAAEPAEEALPTLAVLDSITRGSLPPLKLSMHVWGQEPGKRFAIVDGQRVAEGSLLGNGVVEQIRRDGVVINVNGQRLLLPKP